MSNSIPFFSVDTLCWQWVSVLRCVASVSTQTNNTIINNKKTKRVLYSSASEK